MRKKRAPAEVDLTPLIDVLFILIIFFVLSASFVQGRIPVELPNGRGVPPEKKNIVLAMDKNGFIYLDGQPVSRDSLGNLAKEAVDRGDTLLLTADKSIPYGEVASVLDILRAGGADSVSLGLKGNEP